MCCKMPSSFLVIYPTFVLIAYYVCVDFRVSVVTVASLGKLVYHINYVLKFRASLFTVASFGKLVYHINYVLILEFQYLLWHHLVS